MTEKEVSTLLDDHFSRQEDRSDDDLYILETALLVEQSFGLKLRDEDITPNLLASKEAVIRLLGKKEGY